MRSNFQVTFFRITFFFTLLSFIFWVFVCLFVFCLIDFLYLLPKLYAKINWQSPILFLDQ